MPIVYYLPFFFATQDAAFAGEKELFSVVGKRAEMWDPQKLEILLNQPGCEGKGNFSKSHKFGSCGLAVAAFAPGQFVFNQDKSDKAHLRKLMKAVPEIFRKVAPMTDRKKACVDARKQKGDKQRAIAVGRPTPSPEPLEQTMTR